MQFRSLKALAPVDWTHLFVAIVAPTLLAAISAYTAHGGPGLVVGGINLVWALGYLLAVLTHQTPPAPPPPAPPAAALFSKEPPTNPDLKT